MSSNLEILENRIGYHFHDISLLRHALIHSSYANEKHYGRSGSNERLEFLGDAVLELVSSEFLYERYHSLSEGELTKKRAGMVCEMSLAYCAREFGLQEFILLGKGEEQTGGRNRDSIVSDATEAVIGAVFLDGGFLEARKFIRTHILNDMDKKQLFFDSKTILQEMVQENILNGIEYVLVKEDGPDHDKQFTISVSVNGEIMGTGTGHTKKSAEQSAAYMAIRKIRQA